METMGTSDELKAIEGHDWNVEIAELFMYSSNVNPDDVKAILEKHGVGYRNFYATTDRVHFCLGNVGIRVALNDRGLDKNIKEWYLSNVINIGPGFLRVFDTNGIFQVTETYELLDQSDERPDARPDPNFTVPITIKPTAWFKQNKE